MDVDEQYLARMLERNWFQPVTPTTPRRWTFEDDLRSCPRTTLLALMKMYAYGVLDDQGQVFSDDDATNILAGGKVLVQNRGSFRFDDLVRFLHAITLSKYKFGALSYYPQEVALAEWSLYAADIGWPLDLVRKVDAWWHSRRRTLPARHNH